MESVLDDVPDMRPWIALAELSALRAILRAQAGDIAGAYSDALAPIRLGEIVQSDPSAALLHGVVGTRLKSFGYYAFASLLPLIYPSPEQSRVIARQLGALRTDPSAWRSIWTFEYRVIAPSFAEPSLAEGSEQDEPSARWALRLLPDGYAYHPAETLRIYADQVRELRSYAGRPCSEVRPAPDAGGLSRILLSLSPNGVGRTRLARGARRLRYFELRRCESDTQVAAIQTLIALRAYQVVHGALPPSLESLVPDYLDELPIDAYDGAPLRYDPERAILYSVGSQLRGTEPFGIPEDGRYLAPSYPIDFADHHERPPAGAGACPAKADRDCCK